MLGGKVRMVMKRLNSSGNSGHGVGPGEVEFRLVELDIWTWTIGLDGEKTRWDLVLFRGG